jgi:hypothetical protein
MIERDEHLRLAPEAGQTIGVAGYGRWQDLQGDAAAEFGIARGRPRPSPPAPIAPRTSYAPRRVPAVRDMWEAPSFPDWAGNLRSAADEKEPLALFHPRDEIGIAADFAPLHSPEQIADRIELELAVRTRA